jgi:hypothetical protein
VDIPGLNQIAIERILATTSTTCGLFSGGQHGNAGAHTTGESIRCRNCRNPQWKHWLRQAVATTQDTNELHQTTMAWARAADERDRKQEQIERLLAALKLAESVYRLNCVAPGEPSSVLDAMQAAIAEVEA